MSEGQVSVQERVRGPNLAVFRMCLPGIRLPMEEAIRKANEAGFVIASNKRLDQALVRSKEWKGVCNALPCWSGTMIAYEEPDKGLGETIEYRESEFGMRYVFQVPDKFRGERNLALVAEHPGFTLEREGHDWIVQATGVDAIERFPKIPIGWYFADPKHGIPNGELLDESCPDARYLLRTEKRVGLVSRTCNRSSRKFSRAVHLAAKVSEDLGVVVEAVDEPGETKS